MEDKTEMAGLTADIVAAYVGNDAVPVADLTNIINDVHKAFGKCRRGQGGTAAGRAQAGCAGAPLRDA